MKIQINGKAIDFDFAYPTSYDGVVYLWATEGEDRIEMTGHEWQRLLDIMSVTGWHNDGKAVA